MTNSNTIVDLPGTDKFEFYDFPGRYGDKGDGQSLTDVRMEEEEASHDLVLASSKCKTFSPGGKFKVRQHRCTSEEGNTFVITRIEHRATESMAYETGVSADADDYRNAFQCIPDSVNFRPERATRRPYVQGMQTATVVGPAGEEIYTDKYGRVKVQFPWDREGKHDEQSSCWMRVSQIHAGKNCVIDVPRIGEEVIVSFLECDPDRPIITGRVYHAENMPPYPLPDKKVISGIKSKTYKGDGYNEYILDDTPGEELIREHGQFDKASTIEHDLAEQVGNNRTRDVGVDESVTIGNNQTLSVGSNRQITVGANHAESIGVNMSINVGANLTETVGPTTSKRSATSMALTVGEAMTQSIGAVYALTVGGPMTVAIGASQKTGIGGNRGEQVAGKVTESVGGNVRSRSVASTRKRLAATTSSSRAATLSLKPPAKLP